MSGYDPATIPPVRPEKLRGPEVGALCYLTGRYDRWHGSVVRVQERSYVWAPGDPSYRGGVRQYGWSVIEYAPGRTMVVDDDQLLPLTVGTFLPTLPAID